jgi:2,3-bisphosphoglycerate-dependent phosphoglycerate mutase
MSDGLGERRRGFRCCSIRVEPMFSRDGSRADRAGLVAVRHGQSLANLAFADAEASGGDLAGVGGRDADVALSPAGRGQAAGLGRWVREQMPFRVVCCSPYARARQTWEIAAGELAPGRRPPVVVDERLRDREMGQLELLTSAAIERRFPQEARRRADAGDFYYRPPGGESLVDVALRLRSFLRDADLAERPLLVVHDAVVLMLRYITESLSEDELLRLPPVANASVTQWAVSSGSLRLVVYSDVSHLDGAAGPLGPADRARTAVESSLACE